MYSANDNKAKIYRPFWLILLVFLFCLLANWLPNPKSIFGFTIKPINFFSDFNNLDKVKSDKNIAVKLVKAKTAADSLHFTGVVIDNFYPPTENNFSNFIAKLYELKKKKRKIRIAWFGDSMVEGDLFVQDLRTNLQNEFGGNGVGFVPITSVVGNFRQTIYSENSGDWKTVSILKKEDHKLPLGIGGEAFIPKDGSWVSFSTVNKKHLDSFHVAKIFFYNTRSNASVTISTEDGTPRIIPLQKSNSVQQFEFGSDKENFHHLNLKFNCDSTIYVYGVSFENGSGVLIDNFGVRGSSGVALGTMQPYSLLNNWQSNLPYDLMILEYGLNVVTPTTNNYEWFQKSFPKAIEKMQINFPNSAILLLSLGDRSVKKDGQYATMEQVPLFIEIQKNIAMQRQISFWNMFDAMGGEGSMINWVDEKPRLANKDYTHINAAGGAVLGKKLFETILFEINKRKYKL